MKIHTWLIFLLTMTYLTFVTSCKVDDPMDDPTFDKIFFPGEGYFILNEGAYGQGNASVSYHHKEKDSLYHNIYESVNGQKLGDVLQSMVIHDDKAYLVINNSGLIRIVDPATFEDLGSISGFTSPRYMLPLQNGDAYVSDLFANQIWVVNLEERKIVDSIAVQGWTEEMVMAGNKVFVTSPSLSSPSRNVYVLDPVAHQVIDTLDLDLNPGSIGVDAQGDLQVFCTGDAFSDPRIFPSFYTINPASPSQNSNFRLNGVPEAWSGTQAISSEVPKIYIMYGSVYEADILDFGLSWSNVPLIESLGRNFYGLAVDPESGNILVMDAGNFNELGKILEYKPNGIFVREMSAGVAPSKIVYY